VFCLLFFCIKYPIWPAYSWLPEVHVEATTELSVLLASVILKVGFFGLFKYLFVSFVFYSLWCIGFVDGIIILGLLCVLFCLLLLVDYKKVVALWSVLHTNICIVLLWHNDCLFVGLCIFCNFAHIISSFFSFVCIGFVYNVYGLRIFLFMVSFVCFCSLWSSCFLLVICFNIDFPFTLMFLIELLLFVSVISVAFVYFCVLFLVVLFFFFC